MINQADLKKKDLEVMRADEEGDTAKKAAAVASKQKLRDATDDVRLTNAADEVELKSAMEAICAECEAE